MGAAMKRALGLAAVLIVLDQLSKWWIVEQVMRPPGVWETPFYTATRIEILPFFNLVMAWNRGVSFGIFNNGGAWNAVFLSVLSLVIVAGLIVWLRKVQTTPLALALGAIIGGALGNVIDRVRWGAVADFLDFHLMGHHWPAFNLADSAISIGAAVLVLDALFARPSSSKN